MTDITDPIVFSTVAQTAVLTFTLVIFIMLFRTQNKATKEAAYQKILDDYTDAIRLVLEKPELSASYGSIWRGPSIQIDHGVTLRR